jgi:hypothetical protein
MIWVWIKWIVFIIVILFLCAPIYANKRLKEPEKKSDELDSDVLDG